MPDRYLLESSLVDGYLMEDGLGVLLLDVIAVTHYGVVTMSGVGSLAAAGRMIFAGKATMAGSGLIAAIGSYLHKAKATMLGTGSLAGVGSYLHKAQAVMAGVGSLAAIGTVTGGGGTVHYGVAVMTGSGGISGAGQRVSNNPPFGASVHAIMCSLSFATQALKDQMKSDVDGWLVGKQTWATTNEPTVNDGGSITVRFTSSEDMDDFMAFVESRAVNIPAQSGRVSKHWCGHAAGQPCREIEETII